MTLTFQAYHWKCVENYNQRSMVCAHKSNTHTVLEFLYKHKKTNVLIFQLKSRRYLSKYGLQLEIRLNCNCLAIYRK